VSAPSLLFDAPGPRAQARHRLLTVVGVLIGLGGLALVLWKLNQAGQLDAAMWRRYVLSGDVWTQYLIPGLIKTIEAAAVSIVLALIFGLVFGMGRLSQLAPVRWFCGTVVEFFRAVPVLLMMYFAFQLYTVNNVFGAAFNSFYAVVTGLTLYNGSVIAELVRSGVHSLPKGQREAGWAIGLTPTQTLTSVLLPQAITAMLPSIISQLVVILKDSALGYNIAYLELLRQCQNLATFKGNLIPTLIVLALIYIAINYGLTRIASRVERRLREGKRRIKPVAAASVVPMEETAADEGVENPVVPLR